MVEFGSKPEAMDNLLRVFFAIPQVRSSLIGEGQDPHLGAFDTVEKGQILSS
jgi:hypothetical protein